MAVIFTVESILESGSTATRVGLVPRFLRRRDSFGTEVMGFVLPENFVLV
jgi:hypothetical protein